MLRGGLFNKKALTKWEVHEYLSQFDEINQYLPNTLLYKDYNQLLQFLMVYRCAYMKPITGFKGRKVSKLTYIDDGIKLETVENKKSESTFIKNPAKFFHSNFKKNSYIIQPCLNLNILNDRVVDFRLTIDKDKKGAWKVIGFVGRQGQSGSVVSNRSSGGKVEMGEAILRQAFNISTEELDDLEKNMKTLAVMVAEMLDTSSLHFGKLAIDLGIDQDKRLWIIEVNNRYPNDEIMVFAGKPDLYEELKLTNLLYAKKLAGF
nr:YheC/YheD family protein [Mesobacillus harenae]